MNSALLTLLILAATPDKAQEAPKADAKPTSDAETLVYVKRDGQVSNIYKLNLADSKPVLLFANKDKVNSNCLFPRWSADGKTIQFTP